MQNIQPIFFDLDFSLQAVITNQSQKLARKYVIY